MEVSGQLHTPAALLPGKESLVPIKIGGWVGPRAVLDAMVKRKIPSPRRIEPYNPDRPKNKTYRFRSDVTIAMTFLRQNPKVPSSCNL
jgi:hypothetical protein